MAEIRLAEAIAGQLYLFTRLVYHVAWRPISFYPATSFALFVFEVVAVLGLNRIYLNFASFSFH